MGRWGESHAGAANCDSESTSTSGAAAGARPTNRAPAERAFDVVHECPMTRSRASSGVRIAATRSARCAAAEASGDRRASSHRRPRVAPRERRADRRSRPQSLAPDARPIDEVVAQRVQDMAVDGALVVDIGMMAVRSHGPEGFGKPGTVPRDEQRDLRLGQGV